MLEGERGKEREGKRGKGRNSCESGEGKTGRIRKAFRKYGWEIIVQTEKGRQGFPCHRGGPERTRHFYKALIFSWWLQLVWWVYRLGDGSDQPC